MNAAANAEINRLFTSLEKAARNVDHYIAQELYSDNPGVPRELYGAIAEEHMGDVAKIQKRLVRAFFRAGTQEAIGELEGHIAVGTFPKYAIHAAFNRRPRA